MPQIDGKIKETSGHKKHKKNSSHYLVIDTQDKDKILDEEKPTQTRQISMVTLDEDVQVVSPQLHTG